MYSFANNAASTYKDTDCRSGDAHTMADCLHNMHSDAAWVLKYNTFWATHITPSTVYLKSYASSGGDVRVVTPGRSASAIGEATSLRADVDALQSPGNTSEIII